MREIILTKGYKAIVDDIDFEWLSKFNWFANLDVGGYVSARANHKGTLLKMHRMIMAAYDSNVIVDHIDRNSLNNQRNNLRICTKRENHCNIGLTVRNTSGYKGVNFYKITNRWVAKISINGLRKSIGYFDTKEEAALAYNEMAKLHHGEFAYLNKINT